MIDAEQAGALVEDAIGEFRRRVRYRCVMLRETLAAVRSLVVTFEQSQEVFQGALSRRISDNEHEYEKQLNLSKLSDFAQSLEKEIASAISRMGPIKLELGESLDRYRDLRNRLKEALAVGKHLELQIASRAAPPVVPRLVFRYRRLKAQAKYQRALQADEDLAALVAKRDRLALQLRGKQDAALGFKDLFLQAFNCYDGFLRETEKKQDDCSLKGSLLFKMLQNRGRSRSVPALREGQSAGGLVFSRLAQKYRRREEVAPAALSKAQFMELSPAHLVGLTHLLAGAQERMESRLQMRRRQFVHLLRMGE